MENLKEEVRKMDLQLPTLVLMLCMLPTVSTISEPHQNWTRQRVLGYLLNETKYDPKISPDFERDTATNVSLQVFFSNIHSISELNMDYSADLFLRQSWRDDRLIYENLSFFTRLELGQLMIDKVWVPDTIFVNEKKAEFHQITVPNKLMHLYPNGTVLYSARIAVKMSCSMDLFKFPLDVQNCPLILESYGYTTENLNFFWKEIKPVDISKEIELSQFTIETDIQVSRCDKDYDEAGKFACIQAYVKLTRNTGYYAIQIFVPTILIVVLSWLSFWIDIDATPARISLGVLTVLTMTTQSSGVGSQLPRVSYVKAIDVWMSSCLIFVFAALIEYSYANVLLRKRRKHPKDDQDDYETQEKESICNNKQTCSYCAGISLQARYVDKLSRIAFPTAFIIFNIVFWTYYLFIT